MGKDVYINPLSKCSFLTTIFNNGSLLGSASSFCYLYNGKKYLITNYHVAFGKNPFNGNAISSTGALPDELVFEYYDSNYQLQRKTIDLDEKNIGKSMTLFEGKSIFCDVVAIKLDDSIDCSCINDCEYVMDDVRIDVGIEVFVLGYPIGIEVLKTPIWKRGTIASEPMINANKLPVIFIDSGTKQGMSGSPTIIYSNIGTYRTINGGVAVNPTKIYRFLDCIFRKRYG